MATSAATLAVGTAAAKALLKIWLKDRVVARSVSVGLSELTSMALHDRLDQRRLTRQLEQVADQISEHLDAFFTSEFGGLTSNEKEAATQAVADSIDAVRLGPSIILAHDLDPQQLYKYIVRHSAEVRKQYALAAVSRAFYRLLMSETTTYIVEVFTSLDSFNSELSKNLLERETALAEVAGEILARLPNHWQLKRDANSEFEVLYKRTLARQLDVLELFGVDLPAQARRYNLSVAYISLHAVSTIGRHSAADRDLSDPEDDTHVDLERIDEALADHTRILIRGEAGSGKTTLLKYISVKASQGELPGALTSWNGRTPVFIQLRRYSSGPLPPPESFLEYSTPAIAGAMPPMWMHDQLAAGRVILMADGVDELPAGRRSEVHEWLRGLVATYPLCTYLVTSRPPAINGDWLSDLEFADASLQPLQVPDIMEFIDHWHAAAATGGDHDSSGIDLEQYRQHLRNSVARSSALRKLATNPLMCAMMCALHRDRRTDLPRDRVELYRVALEMLLSRRDSERRVAPAGERIELSLRERELPLRQLALWLMMNNKSDIERSAAIKRFERSVVEMPGLEMDGGTLFQELLERSGLLREPVAGRIDFVHRTFQEFLAAKEAVAQDLIGLLVDKAESDQWRETIELAAGVAGAAKRAELLNGLLKRGNKSKHPERRARFHLLAVACLDAAPELPVAVQRKVGAALERLVPPQTVSEAEVLASAGEIAVPFLKFTPNRGSRENAACVRALRRIGSPTALTELAAYARDERKAVMSEIVKSWEDFDRDEYEERVISQVSLAGFVMKATRQNLDLAEGMRDLSLDLKVEGDQMDLDRLRRVSHQIARADISEIVLSQQLADVLVATSALRIRDCAVLDRDLTLDVPHAHTLLLSDLNQHHATLSVLGPQLTQLGLNGTGGCVLPVAPLLDVERLEIVREDVDTASRVINSCPHLTELQIARLAGDFPISAVENLGRLQSVSIFDTPIETSLWSYLETVEYLALVATNVTDLHFIARLPRLRQLVVTDSPDLAVVSALAGAKELEAVHLLGVPSGAVDQAEGLLQAWDLSSSSIDSLTAYRGYGENQRRDAREWPFLFGHPGGSPGTAWWRDRPSGMTLMSVPNHTSDG